MMKSSNVISRKFQHLTKIQENGSGLQFVWQQQVFTTLRQEPTIRQA